MLLAYQAMYCSLANLASFSDGWVSLIELAN